MQKSLDSIRKKSDRIIVGIETANTSGRLAAAIVEVSGKGDDTVLNLHSFRSLVLPPELQSTLEALESDDGFDAEELASINFLVNYNIRTLFLELAEESGIEPEEVDIIGLKCMEVAGKVFPEDPTALSEMTGCIVASHFRIGLENGDGPGLDVREPILQGMVDSMIEKFGLETETREAVAVALLANESIYHENPDSSGGAERTEAVSESGRNEDTAGLFGEFYFPA